MRPDFRPFVPAPGTSKIAGPTARAHTEARLSNPRAQALFGGWAENAKEPFTGITTDGTPRAGLFALRPEGAPASAMIEATRALLARLSPDEAARAVFSIDSPQWRNWQNTEMYIETFGLRLDEVSDAVREGVIAVLQASLSARGFAVTRDVMKLNAFLGELTGGPAVMGEWSYTFCLFGAPSLDAPWGWQLFGHHLCLHCFVIGTQMTITPTFFGAEPCYGDEGRYAGISLFEDEERAGLALMRALAPEQRRRAIVAHSMMGGDLPEGRRHFADNLHLGGAFQDNRVVAYEGLVATDMAPAQRQALLDLVQAYVGPLPDGPAAARMSDIEKHLGETHFCWIGGFDEQSAFYYRVQSPVVMIEFDHHTGVFLTNAEPAKFHVHTIVRTPNGNDYGADLLRLHYQTAPHHRATPHPSTGSG